ncbi:hypothetical protein OF83DRAFT_931852 [Amylostereum chailletii]|nr:hypothetical protein OF83DRAFT_931852 [Amylostereum chailletii]
MTSPFRSQSSCPPSTLRPRSPCPCTGPRRTGGCHSRPPPTARDPKLPVVDPRRLCSLVLVANDQRNRTSFTLIVPKPANHLVLAA